MRYERPKEARYLRDPFVLFCVVLVACGAVGFGYWAATAQLAQGITAGGVLIAETRRYPVQHLEGGIIQEIAITEGDSVTAGAVAMVISDAASAARLSQAKAEMHGLLAYIDRLTAQITGEDKLIFERLRTAAEPIERRELEALNTRLFEDERAALDGERALIRAKIARLNAQSNALEVRRAGKRREIASLEEEQSVQSQALNRQLGNVSRVNELARLLAMAETALAEIDEDERVIVQSIVEADLELRQIDLRVRATWSDDLELASRELATVRQEVIALEDRRLRSRVIVPVDGDVIDLAFSAVGGVVAPGERVFDIVPSASTKNVEVRFLPRDRDDLRTGRAVNLRFTTLDPITPPEISGTLDRIAADATQDPQTGSYYYLATVTVPPAAWSALDGFEITAGIPVEVFFDKGTPRTPLSYFIEPVARMMRLGMQG